MNKYVLFWRPVVRQTFGVDTKLASAFVKGSLFVLVKELGYGNVALCWPAGWTQSTPVSEESFEGPVLVQLKVNICLPGTNSVVKINTRESPFQDRSSHDDRPCAFGAKGKV
jgi:hypothetical protein